MTERVIDREGEQPNDWTLLVTDAGEVVARKQVPFDGVLTFSTASRQNRPTKNSEYGLDPGTVIDRYCRRADTQTSRPALVDDVQAALGAVAQEEGDDAA